MKKGSLLISLALLLAMMMGMNVYAKEYDLGSDADDIWSNRIARGTILCPSDSIRIGGSEGWTLFVNINGSRYTVSGNEEEQVFTVSEGKYYEVGNWGRDMLNKDITVDLTTCEAPAQGGDGDEKDEEPDDTDDGQDKEPDDTDDGQGGESGDAGNGQDDELGEEERDDDDSDDDDSKDEESKPTEEQIFTKELLTSAVNVKTGDTMAIDATRWHSFSAKTLKELLNKEGVNYTLYFNYEGEAFYIAIPAGAALEEGCEWYGPLKLSAMFGKTSIDMSELQAAINK